MTDSPAGKSFDALYAELRRKVDERTSRLGDRGRVDAGVHEIGKKIVEEAAEVWMAAEYQSQERCRYRDQPAALSPSGADDRP